MKSCYHTTSLSTLAACALLLGAMAPAAAAEATLKAAAPVQPVIVTTPSTTQLPAAPQAAAAEPLSIYIPNPHALRKAAAVEALDKELSNGAAPGSQHEIGNATEGNSDTPSITLPDGSMNVAQKNASRYGSLKRNEPSEMQQALAAATTPFTAALSAMGSMFDNTRTVLTTVTMQIAEETTRIAQQNTATLAEIAIAEPVPEPAAAPKTKPKAPQQRVAKAKPAPAPAPVEMTQAPAPAAATETFVSAAPAAPAVPVAFVPRTPAEAIQAALPVPAADLADAMPAAPAQVLAEGPVASPGAIVYYQRASGNFTRAQAEAANDMSRLTPAAGVETIPAQGPLDTSPIMGTPEQPAPLIAPTTTQTMNAPGVASETPSPIAAPPAKSESAIAITESKSLPADVKKTLKKTPSGLTTNPPLARGKTPVDIERSKTGDGKEAYTPDPKTTQAMTIENRMNVKIQKRAPSMDLNYELELAYRALITGNTEVAIERYKSVLANDAENKNALFGLATTYHRIGQLDKARALYARLLKIDPAHRDGLNNYLALASEESPQEALLELQSLESRNPDFGPIPAQMAVIYQRMGQTDQALDKMARAVSLAPNNITYLYNLAVLLDKAGRYKDAAGIYKQIIEASYKGETVNADLSRIQQRLTFLNAKNP